MCITNNIIDQLEINLINQINNFKGPVCTSNNFTMNLKKSISLNVQSYKNSIYNSSHIFLLLGIDIISYICNKYVNDMDYVNIKSMCTYIYDTSFNYIFKNRYILYKLKKYGILNKHKFALINMTTIELMNLKNEPVNNLTCIYDVELNVTDKNISPITSELCAYINNVKYLKINELYRDIDIYLPNSLKCLSLNANRDSIIRSLTITKIYFPPNLLELDCHNVFCNQFPRTLKKLILENYGHKFIENVDLSYLINLTILDITNYGINKLPPNIKKLTVKDHIKITTPLRDSIKELNLITTDLKIVEFPSKLKKLEFNGSYLNYYSHLLNRLPSKIEYLFIGYGLEINIKNQLKKLKYLKEIRLDKFYPFLCIVRHVCEAKNIKLTVTD